jgi:hypothetical protein
MLKRILTFILFALTTNQLLLAQAGEWTWLKGSDSLAYAGSFGTMGVTNSTNAPPALYEGAQWTDQQGNFWFYGGVRVGTYAALWEYVPTTNNWVWISGSRLANAVGAYGTKGVPSSSNYPPARGWGVATWVDLNGNFWLYGGQGGGFYSDMWQYNPASNKWTWMQGTSGGGGAAAVYGTQGVASSSNTPGARLECAATWVDSAGNLWLFGGLNPSGCLNDLWMYNISTNEWTWMNGYNGNDASSTYGTMGVAAAANAPGSRTAYGSWTDKKGKFWLFGGGDPAGTGSYSDMWEYDPSTNMWAWMSGDSGVAGRGNYGSKCSPSTAYYPTARSEDRARWTDPCGNFWLYGGFNVIDSLVTYCDFWEFNPVTLQWMLVNGNNINNVSPVFGTMGVASVSNTPGGRGGAISWMDASGNLYIFGGTVDGFLNAFGDLWKFTPDPACSFTSFPPIFNLGNDTLYCSSFSRVLSTGYASTVWSTGDTSAQITATTAGTYWASISNTCGTESDTIRINKDSIDVSVTPSTSIICTNDSAQLCATSGLSGYTWNSGQSTRCIITNLAGNYYVTVTDANHCTAQSNHVSVSVYPAPPISISVNGDTLSVYNVTSCQWYLNGEPLNGATSTVYIALVAGNYTVSVVDSNGCTSLSNPVIMAGLDNIAVGNIAIYPNPSITGWNLNAGADLLGSIVELYDANGRIVYHSVLETPKTLIDPAVAQGVYFLKISSLNHTWVLKLIKL